MPGRIADQTAGTGEEAAGLTKGGLQIKGIWTGDTQDPLPEASRKVSVIYA